MATHKYAKHVQTPAADYEFDRSKRTLTACTPRALKNMQKHVPDFMIENKTLNNIKLETIDAFADEIRSEGFTVAFVGEGVQAKAA